MIEIFNGRNIYWEAKKSERVISEERAPIYEALERFNKMQVVPF